MEYFSDIDVSYKEVKSYKRPGLISDIDEQSAEHSIGSTSSRLAAMTGTALITKRTALPKKTAVSNDQQSSSEIYSYDEEEEDSSSYEEEESKDSDSDCMIVDDQSPTMLRQQNEWVAKLTAEEREERKLRLQAMREREKKNKPISITDLIRPDEVLQEATPAIEYDDDGDYKSEASAKSKHNNRKQSK